MVIHGQVEDYEINWTLREIRGEGKHGGWRLRRRKVGEGKEQEKDTQNLNF